MDQEPCFSPQYCYLQVKMVTGDQYAIAVETSRRLGLGTNIMEGEELLGNKASDKDFAKHVEAMDGFAGVFPEHKHRIVEAVQQSGRLVGMTGPVCCRHHHTSSHVCLSIFVSLSINARLCTGVCMQILCKFVFQSASGLCLSVKR